MFPSSIIVRTICFIFMGFLMFVRIPRRIWHSMVGNMPILNLRYEPLSKVENRFLKRLFDIVLSGIFLVAIFPLIYLIVGVVIKMTSRSYHF